MQLAIGTDKGGYIVDGETGQVNGPLFPGWKVTAFGRTPDGDHLAGVGSNWFGTAIHRSADLNAWSQIEDGPSYGEERELSEIWTFHTSGDSVYTGVAEAGLFRSDDGGTTWGGIQSLNEHRTREDWVPGGGGLCAHTILEADDTMWVGISAVGVFRSDDGGTTWDPKNDGVSSAVADEDAPPPEVGYCVHSLAHDPSGPHRMWRQDHMGVFRTESGGDTWERIENGLPAGFGFVMQRDHASGRLFTVPLHSDGNRVPVDGAFRAYVSHDDGDSWEVSGQGWGSGASFTSVLRGAAAADGEGMLALGTTGGTVWITRDAGDHWSALDAVFPRIGAVALL
ncbi:MAG: WD40/YVTN/BNR-like repeat-containing protein [Acidimicrobiia bacterium]